MPIMTSTRRGKTLTCQHFIVCLADDLRPFLSFVKSLCLAEVSLFADN
ncbi:hypothetical protein GGD40_003320 [Paraburkholderia bryophila]|uniref:Uncharacterized protein n=1 Tax=Paraburkholderia bryophila TaxID=420952 RepID=A0A7Z0B6U8_9BURK|nr:hypothetical protein [Paraburkholderia bryophila]